MSRAWIGIHDRNEEGKFETVLEKDPKEIYFKWTIVSGHQQPDSGVPAGTGDSQNCVSLVRTAQDREGMDDNICSDMWPYFCQYSHAPHV